jgi:hypothetical protein
VDASLGAKNTASIVRLLMGDGNKRLTYFSLGSDGKLIREFVVGTGKYEGLVTAGTVEPLEPFPVIKARTVQDCNHQTGTYKLK